MSRRETLIWLLVITGLLFALASLLCEHAKKDDAEELRMRSLESRISVLEREVFLAQFQISQKAPRVERDETSVPFPYFDPTLLVPDSAPLQYDSWKNVIHK